MVNVHGPTLGGLAREVERLPPRPGAPGRGVWGGFRAGAPGRILARRTHPL